MRTYRFTTSDELRCVVVADFSGVTNNPRLVVYLSRRTNPDSVCLSPTTAVMHPRIGSRCSSRNLAARGRTLGRAKAVRPSRLSTWRIHSVDEQLHAESEEMTAF
jgi:hypothetical protein